MCVWGWPGRWPGSSTCGCGERGVGAAEGTRSLQWGRSRRAGGAGCDGNFAFGLDVICFFGQLRIKAIADKFGKGEHF